MKVLYTESSKNVGGQELQAMEQLLAFQRMGYEILFACKPHSDVEKLAIKKNIPTYSISFRNSCHIPSIRKLRKLIQQYKPSFIVSHSGHDTNTSAIATMFMVNKPKLIRQKTYLTSKIKPFGINHLADQVIVPSLGMKNLMIENGCYENKIAVVYPGFDFDLLSSQSKMLLPKNVQTWLDKSTVPVIGQVGMLRGEKGHSVILEALSILKQSGHSFRYLIVGDGPNKSAINKMIVAYGLENEVMLAGKISPASPVYPHVDLIVMPSTNESFGMAIVEAMYFNIPVIASNVGGIPEIIQDGITGFLLPSDDVNAWKVAIEHFLINPERYKNLANNASENLLKRYSIDSCIKKIIDVSK